MKSYVIQFAMAAGRNFELRAERLSDARGAVGAQRQMFVEFARRHHKLGMENLRDARHWLQKYVQQQKEAA